MKKMLATVMALSLVVGALGAPALAGKKKKKKKAAPVTLTFEESGSITLPGPSAAAVTGLTEAEFRRVHNCGSIPASQGLDAWVVEIPEAFRGGTASIEAVGADATSLHDLDVYFYDAACAFMTDTELINGTDESGLIPAGANWAVVSLFAGAQATFDLTGSVTVTP